MGLMARKKTRKKSATAAQPKKSAVKPKKKPSAKKAPKAKQAPRSKSKAKAKGKKTQAGSSGVQYGVLKGSVTRGKREPDKNKPHYTMFLEAGGAQQAVVNVRSSVGDEQTSEVMFFVDSNLLGQAPDRAELLKIWKKKLTALDALDEGFTALPDHQPGIALDYVREAYVHPNEMRRLPADEPDADDDVQDELDLWVKRAVAQSATAYVFGSRFPGGIHDVHMNQGNSGSFAADNGAFQDGGLVFSFTSGISVGIFVAFQAQSWDTDSSGNPK